MNRRSFLSACAGALLSATLPLQDLLAPLAVKKIGLGPIHGQHWDVVVMDDLDTGIPFDQIKWGGRPIYKTEWE